MIMRKFFAFLFRHGTAISLVMLALAWVPLVLVKTFGGDTWAVFGWLLLLGMLGLVWNALGTVLAGLTAVRLERKRDRTGAVLAFVANLVSLLLLFGALR
jgi:hypothetical protein